MPHYVVLLIGGLFSLGGLSGLAYLVIAIRADKADLPAIARAMKKMPPPRDGEHGDDSQGPPSLPSP